MLISRAIYAAGVVYMLILMLKALFTASIPMERPVFAPSLNIITKQILLEHLAELGKEMLLTRNESKCKTKVMGSGWGGHTLCDSGHPDIPCVFYSYGTSRDFSFDTAMADEWGCKGVALDPSVSHASKLHPNVTFHVIAARTADRNADKKWHHVTTVPGLKRFLRHKHITVLKMDCEGCEYALAEDILLEDPDFFHAVDQFAIELHVSQKWLKTDNQALLLGQLYKLVKEAGLSVADTHFGGCNPSDEAAGCLPLLQNVGFPCQSGMMCVDVLFARL